MEAITDLLTPEQIDTIVAAYGTVAEWCTQVGQYISTQANIIVEDMYV